MSIIRVDVNSMSEWITNIWKADSFHSSYKATVMIQHTHNNPVLITFFELMFLVTQSVNSNPDLDDEDRVKLNR